MRIKIFLSVLCVLSFLHQGIACSCPEPTTIANEINRSSLIFKGQVLKMDTIGTDGNQELLVHLKRMESYKGLFVSDTVLIRTQLGEGSCGFPFELEKVYLVYTFQISLKSALRKEDFPDMPTWEMTDTCTRTVVFSSEAKNLLNEGLRELH